MIPAFDGLLMNAVLNFHNKENSPETSLWNYTTRVWGVSREKLEEILKSGTLKHTEVKKTTWTLHLLWAFGLI